MPRLRNPSLMPSVIRRSRRIRRDASSSFTSPIGRPYFVSRPPAAFSA